MQDVQVKIYSAMVVRIPSLTEEAVQGLLAQGKKISAIKLLRAVAEGERLPLLEAKSLVEFLAGVPHSPSLVIEQMGPPSCRTYLIRSKT